MFYGTLKSRTSTPQGSYIQFNQNAFCAEANCAAIGMDSKGSGINEWADNNNILVLYPQTIASVIPVNADGCWDWWGYTGGNYAAQSAPQMTAIMNMVNKITSGY